LVIPQDVQHGQELICSYPACRESGVKFCFCKHCHIPVAKHNFRSRHHHVKDEETTATKSSPATTICVDCNPQTVVMNESSSSLVSSTSASTNNNSTPAAFNLGTAVQQQFLGAATAGALMMNPPGVPPNLELFYSSLLLEDYVTTIRKQQTILPDNVSNSNLSSNNTRINNPASAAGRLLAQDFFAPLPKGELVAGPHNRFPSNIISLAAGSNNNNTISSSYYNIEKQQRPAGASTPQVKSQWSPSVPDSHRTWPCQARGSDEEHKRVSVYRVRVSLLLTLLMVDSHMFVPSLFQNCCTTTTTRRRTLSSHTISNMELNWSVRTQFAKARVSSSAFALFAIYQLPSHAFAVATTTAILHLQHPHPPLVVVLL
jgi:hypothetical protein